MSLRILVTGGAGYIGSHFVKQLGEQTFHQIVAIDNLSSGHREAVLYGDLLVEDLADMEKLEQIFDKYKFDAVFHFAADIVVSESVSKPFKYYKNNSFNTINLLEKCLKHKVKNFIFSSTAAVYGEPSDGAVIDEQYPTNPINPYGRSKLVSEWIVQDAAVSHPHFNYAILRYFNVAGSEPTAKIGLSHNDSTHLIPSLAKIALKKRDNFTIFGKDYPTHDGTCIRDYIHVEDLANAHLKILEYLQSENRSGIFNCGYGHGYSVREVVDAMRKASGCDFQIEVGERRAGDPSVLLADSSLLKSTTGWIPKYDDIEKICFSALSWEKHPKF
jgi:UDP-glucose 4-epimerase